MHVRDQRALGRIGDHEACTIAEHVARVNGATIVECDVSADGTVRVDASVRLAGSVGILDLVRTAYAGPAGAERRQ
jgi:hypothetical protein